MCLCVSEGEGGGERERTGGREGGRERGREGNWARERACTRARKRNTGEGERGREVKREGESGGEERYESDKQRERARACTRESLIVTQTLSLPLSIFPFFKHLFNNRRKRKWIVRIEAANSILIRNMVYHPGLKPCRRKTLWWSAYTPFPATTFAKRGARIQKFARAASPVSCTCTQSVR